MKIETATPLLRVRDLRVTYTRSSGWGRERIQVTALSGIDLDVPRASTLAVVGESGGGKSTLARCLALLERPTSGEIWVEDVRVNDLEKKELRTLRPRYQLIHQDPSSAVQPRWTAAEIIAEPLRVAGWGDRESQRGRTLDLMEEVGLGHELADRRPHELSGGQKQRLVLARALAARPKLLILDESLSGLDLSLQARIVNLLLRLRQRHALTYVLISHDMRLAEYLADQIAVIDRGNLVEVTSNT